MRNHNTKWSARRVQTIGFVNENQNNSLSFNLLCGIIGLFFLMGSAYAQKEYKVLPNDGALSDQFGNAVSISESRAIVGALHNDENLVNGGAAYIYAYDEDTDSWIQDTKLFPIDGNAYDEFGASVAISGNRVAVGAPNHASAAGAVYIYEKNDSAWVEVAKLTSSDIDLGDYFGAAVSMHGNRVLVGARGDNSIYGYDQGAAYVFAMNDSTNEWQEEAKLVPTASGTLFGFGTALDLSESHAIVNCRFDRTNGNNNSSVYVFKRTESTWVEETRLLGTNTQTGDIFGASVAVDGDLALVGAYLNDEDAPDAGSAYAYRYESDSTDTTGVAKTWVALGRIGASDAERRSFFGKTIALSGSQALISSTGFDTPSDSSVVADAGAVYRFSYDEIAGWVEQEKYSREDGIAYDQLGSSVAMEGRHSIMGAVGSDVNGSNSGIAYILVQPDPNKIEIDITGDQTVYLGYDPTSCATLTVEGAPEGSTIVWNTGDSTSTITVCPDSAGGMITYSVLVVDSRGNSATADFDVCVVDISCGEGQVSMCIRSTLTGTYHTLCVSTIWVPTYLSYPGFEAKLGGCDLDLCNPVEEPDTTQQNRLAREVPEVLVNAFPNPFVDQVTIMVQLPTSTRAVLEVYDLAGKKMAQLFEGNVDGGQVYEYTWKAKNMIPGVYIYRLQTDTEVITSKMLLAR